MNYTLSFSTPALVEITYSYNWYEDKRVGLGEEFKAEIRKSAARVLNNPYAYPPYFDDVRKILLARFSFRMYYQIFDNEIVVLGVDHTKRKPRDEF